MITYQLQSHCRLHTPEAFHAVLCRACVLCKHTTAVTLTDTSFTHVVVGSMPAHTASSQSSTANFLARVCLVQEMLEDRNIKVAHMQQ